jgi:hypothetical protein
MLKVIATVAFLILSVMQAKAQETLLTIGTAGNVTATNSPAGSVSGQTVSTAEIDSRLRNVAPGLFGQNFTRDKANNGFADFANFKNGLALSLTQAIQTAEPSIQITSLTINTTTLNLRLAQQTNSVSAQLGTISASAAGRKNVGVPLFCNSATLSFSLDNIMVRGDYNFISGDVSNASADFAVNNVNFGCTGLLSFLPNLLFSIGGVDGLIAAAIKNEAMNRLEFVNMKRLFSLADFANGLNYFRNETPVTVVANQAISIFKELVNDAAINTPGIVLDFRVEFAQSAASLNKIGIFASSSAPSAQLPPAGDRLIFSLPPNSSGVDIYARDAFNQNNWTYLGFAQSSPVYFSSLPRFSAAFPIYIVTSRSSIIPGLNSFPAQTKESNGAGVGAGRK